MAALNRVGVRELRQNLSVYLARISEGETLEVTDHGQPVAILAPLVAGEPILARLQREGHVVAATTDLLTTRARRQAAQRRASGELRRDRDERRL